jgi:glycerol-3-phosphate acyltransferase PlsY
MSTREIATFRADATLALLPGEFVLGSYVSVELIGAIVLGYICGAIPFGLLLTRIAGTRDIRTIGSGNIGATNVLRTGRKDLAAATLILDGLKGAFAVLVTRHLWGLDASLAAACAAFVGHVFPIWLRFRGGKGVATYLGCLFGVYWPAGLVFAVFWLVVASTTRYSSLSALVASLISPAALLMAGQPQASAFFLLLTIALWWTHRANIVRLAAKTEGKIGQKS